tara:strand:- start:98 stop:1270 length:1173 start_codon:yes stop_codon:yes gene_type:complete
LINKGKIVFITGYYDVKSNYQEIEFINQLSISFEVNVITSKYSFVLFKDINIESEDSSNNPNIIIYRLDTYFHIKSMMMLKNINNLIKKINPQKIFIQPAGQLIGFNIIFSYYNFKNREKFHITFQDNQFQYNYYKFFGRFVKRTFFYFSKGLFYIPQFLFYKNIYNNTHNGINVLRPLTYKKINLAPLSVNKSKFYFDQNLRDLTRDKLSICNNDKVILIVGKITPPKKIEELINFFNLSNLKKIKIIIAGFSNSKYNLKVKNDILLMKNLNGKILLYDYLNASELNALYNCSDFGIWYVQPAITIQQAAATGLNCIIPDTNAFNHLRDDYRNISKFKNKDYQAFKNCFSNLFSNYKYDSLNRKYDANKFIQFNSIKYVLERYYKINFS